MLSAIKRDSAFVHFICERGLKHERQQEKQSQMVRFKDEMINYNSYGHLWTVNYKKPTTY